MKSSMNIICVITILAAAGLVSAAAVSLSGTLTGTDWNAVKDDGDGNHGYAMDRAGEDTFYWSDGSTIRITGTVDVRNLAGGSYLQIGLVDKQLADISLSDPTEENWWSGFMFNNSAFATFYAGTRNYARLSDHNSSYSTQLYNPSGNTAGVFDFSLDISSDGTMGLTLHGDTDASTSYSYGTCNWGPTRMGLVDWLGGELENGSYMLAQVWFDTGSTVNAVSADYSITGVSVAPEPATMLLLGLGGLFLRKRK